VAENTVPPADLPCAIFLRFLRDLPARSSCASCAIFLRFLRDLPAHPAPITHHPQEDPGAGPASHGEPGLK
jgi:hypothetical protein